MTYTGTNCYVDLAAVKTNYPHDSGDYEIGATEDAIASGAICVGEKPRLKEGESLEIRGGRYFIVSLGPEETPEGRYAIILTKDSPAWDFVVLPLRDPLGDDQVLIGHPVPNMTAQEHAEVATCIWEWCLETAREDSGSNGAISKILEEHGHCEIRSRMCALAPFAEAFYRKAVKVGYDSPFDWEFIPEFMTDVYLPAYNQSNPIT